MFGIGGFELFVIILFGLLIFGPDKMPQLGRTVGRTMRQFNKVQDDMKRVITAEMYSKDPNKDSSPFKPQESVLKKYENTAPEEKVVGASEQPAEANAPSQADLLYGLSEEEPSTKVPVDPAPSPESSREIPADIFKDAVPGTTPTKEGER